MAGTPLNLSGPYPSGGYPAKVGVLPSSMRSVESGGNNQNHVFEFKEEIHKAGNF
jgi:hypothetical protein